MIFGPGSKLPNGETVTALHINGGFSIYTTESGNQYKIPSNTEAEYFGVQATRCEWDKEGKCNKPIGYKCKTD